MTIKTFALGGTASGETVAKIGVCRASIFRFESTDVSFHCYAARTYENDVRHIRPGALTTCGPAAIKHTDAIYLQMGQ